MSRSWRVSLLVGIGLLLGLVASAQPAETYADELATITQGPILQDVDDELAVLTWSTHTATENRAFYGTDPNNLTNIAEAPNRLKIHRLNLINLKPNTTYYFQIDLGQMTPASTHPLGSFVTVARGAPPLQNQRPQMTGGTPAVPAIAITRAPIIQFADESSAVISWNTSAPVATTLSYGNSPNKLRVCPSTLLRAALCIAFICRNSHPQHHLLFPGAPGRAG